MPYSDGKPPFYRCANNIFRYCKEVPDFDVAPQENEVYKMQLGGHCRKDPETCGLSMTNAEQIGDDAKGLEKSVKKAFENVNKKRAEQGKIELW